MVGPGVEMGLHPGHDGVLVTPGDDGIDQRVGTAVGEVVVAPAEAAKVVGVVRQPEVGGHVGASRGPGLLGIGGQDHRLLGT